MAVYNTEFKLIKRAIDSVLNQNFKDFELIIIDDGSNNYERECLMNYIEKNEDRIIYIRHSNRGQSESINRGVLNSGGEFITIIDSDDEYKPHHLSACIRFVKNYDLICSTTETIVDNIDDYYVPDKNNLNILSIWTMLFYLAHYLVVKRYLKASLLEVDSLLIPIFTKKQKNIFVYRKWI